MIKRFERKRVCKFISIACCKIVRIVLVVGQETTYIGGPNAESHADIDIAGVDCGAYRIAATTQYVEDVADSPYIDTVGHGKRFTVAQISGLAIDIKPERLKADSDLGPSHSGRDSVVDGCVWPLWCCGHLPRLNDEVRTALRQYKVARCLKIVQQAIKSSQMSITYAGCCQTVRRYSASAVLSEQ